VAGVILLALIGLVLLAGAALAGTAGGDPSAAGALTPTVAGAEPATVVVQPGDTLWTIAAEVAPDVDVRVTVDRLVERNGDTALQVGQVLEIPAG
jgi:Tfp pilus assembly protein FimV